MALAEATYPYVHTISEEEAKASLPELRRSRLPTELPPALWKMYDTMAEELYMILEGDNSKLISVSNALAATMKLRQLITCPAMIDPSLGLGPAIEAIGDKIEEGEDNGNWLHNVVFSPFLQPLPLFKEYLSQRFKIPPQKIYIMKGGMEIEDVQAVEQAFRTDPESMVLCSTRYSSSFNLETARNMYHAHFEWDQDANKQAEARGRRKDGTQPFINSYYVTIANTISEDMADVINHKEHINKISYQDVAALKERLRSKFTE